MVGFIYGILTKKIKINTVIYKKTQIMLNCSLDDKYLITLDDGANVSVLDIESCNFVYEMVKIGYDKMFLFKFKQKKFKVQKLLK